MRDDERFHVSSVIFTHEGVELTFMEVPGDVRQEGRLIRTRSYAVQWDNPNYRDELEELRSLATTLVVDVDEDWPAAPVYEPAPPDAEDEGIDLLGGS